MINWQYYPKSLEAPNLLKEVVKSFEKIESEITSMSYKWPSIRVLGFARPHLEKIGFKVEEGKKAEQKIKITVLFGLDGKPIKSFEVDTYHENSRTVIEVEAGRAVTNYQFLKDFFEACIMHNTDYLILVIRKIYRKKRISRKF